MSNSLQQPRQTTDPSHLSSAVAKPGQRELPTVPFAGVPVKPGWLSTASWDRYVNRTIYSLELTGAGKLQVPQLALSHRRHACFSASWKQLVAPSSGPPECDPQSRPAWADHSLRSLPLGGRARAAQAPQPLTDALGQR